MSRHRCCPGRLQARRDCRVVSPWLLSLISATCHHAAPPARDGASLTMGLSIALPPKWRWGNMSSAFINSLSQQPRRAALAYNTYSCQSLPSTASPALLHIFQSFLQTACRAPHFRRESHMASYVFTAQPLQTTSTGLKVVTPTDRVCVFVSVCVWCSCVRERVCEQLKKKK